MFRSVPDQLQQAEFVQLYSKMAQTLALSGVVGQSPSALLSIQIPGVVVKPGLDPNDPETEYYVSNFLNLTLECNYVATAKAASVSDVYKLILDGKELPLIDLSPAEKKMLAEARAYLFDATGEPTPQYTAYIDYGQRYFAAQDALEAAQASHDNGGPKVSASIKEAFAKASENWLDKGHKEDVDRARAVIEPRVEELFTLVQQVIRDSGYDDLLSSGIVLTGGSSQMPGMIELAEDVFLKPVRMAVPTYHGGLADVVCNPRFSTVMGLLQEAQAQSQRGRVKVHQGGGFRQILARMKEWFNGNF